MPRKTAGVLRVMLVVFSVCIVCAQTAAVDQTAAASASPPDLKFFEAATNLANTLTNSAFPMIGGSILAILGTRY